ncbi:MAG: hypothetical protein WBA31_04020 [Candidatus Dormiibacterota bacterium]
MARSPEILAEHADIAANAALLWGLTCLMADLSRIAIGSPTSTWGESRLDEDDTGRAACIRALLLATETDDYTEPVR